MKEPTTEDRWFEGGCHCGAVRFRVRLRSREVLDCNCSICAKKGHLHAIAEPEDFELTQGEAELQTYRFGTRTAKHRFCKVCGIAPFYIPRSHPNHVDVNARCLDDLGADDFSVKRFDGRHWEDNVDTIR